MLRFHGKKFNTHGVNTSFSTIIIGGYTMLTQSRAAAIIKVQIDGIFMIFIHLTSSHWNVLSRVCVANSAITIGEGGAPVT